MSLSDARFIWGVQLIGSTGKTGTRNSIACLLAFLLVIQTEVQYVSEERQFGPTLFLVINPTHPCVKGFEGYRQASAAEFREIRIDSQPPSFLAGPLSLVTLDP
jgi:hypothetical protein